MKKYHRNIYYRMNYLDLLPDDLIEVINKKLIESQNKEKRKIRKEKKTLKTGLVVMIKNSTQQKI